MKKGSIILIGFMGSGKTTFGRWLERHHEMKLVDTDEYIVEREQRTINDIFASEGEEYFRGLETEALRELSDKNEGDMVISVGGGLPLRDVNGELLHELGMVIYLRAKTETLEKRLAHDKTRPLLAGGNLHDGIEELMRQRSGIYEQRADLIIDTDDLTFEKMYERIKEYENSCN